MKLSCPLGIRALSRKENLSCFGVLSHIINPLLSKLARSRWLGIGLVLFYGPRRSQKKNLAKKTWSKKELGQYPAILTEQAWSITHIYYTCFSCTNKIFLASIQHWQLSSSWNIYSKIVIKSKLAECGLLNECSKTENARIIFWQLTWNNSILPDVPHFPTVAFNHSGELKVHLKLIFCKVKLISQTFHGVFLELNAQTKKAKSSFQSNTLFCDIGQLLPDTC